MQLTLNCQTTQPIQNFTYVFLPQTLLYYRLKYFLPQTVHVLKLDKNNI